MMCSNSKSVSEKYTDDEMVVIDIYENLGKLPIKDDENCDIVRVCHVPKSMSSAKAEAFVPQFVGLGPYHHFRAELLMTEELKLGLAKRVLKLKGFVRENSEALHQRLQNFVADIQIQAFYHVDVHTTCDYHTLLRVLTIDGLFLLGLLHSGAGINDLEERDPYLLTGTRGMPLVRVSGEELTVDAIVRDVFMLENQIPIHVLKQLSSVNINSLEIQQVDNDLGLAVLNFCEARCPLVRGKLSKSSEAHEHLLDLMYHLIVEREAEPEPEPEPELEPYFFVFYIAFQITGYTLIILWIVLWVGLYFLMVIQQLILAFLRPFLVKVIPWALGPISGQLVKIPSIKDILRSAIAALHAFLIKNQIIISIVRLVKPYRRIFGHVREMTRGLLQPRDSTNTSDDTVRIPSATELHNTLVFEFKAAEGGISSIKYDEETFLFHWPKIRLDGNSEVIIANLVAYESLNKSNDLIFTRYIELMSALVTNSEDVKLLVSKKIIETQLNYEVVVQLFKGMVSESIRHTKVPDLEKEIQKVNTMFDSMQKLNWLRIEISRASLMLLVAIAVFPLLAQALMQIYCNSLFGSSRFCKQPGVGDYGRNNSFLTAM